MYRCPSALDYPDFLSDQIAALSDRILVKGRNKKEELSGGSIQAIYTDRFGWAGGKSVKPGILTARPRRAESPIATDKQKIDTDYMIAIAVIPARLASTRLPRKILRQIAGRTMIARVYEGVRSSPLLDDVIVATDSDEIMQICRQHGWNARMTSARHRSGTERVHEISSSVAADVYLNVQGDEPLTRAEHIAALLDLMQDPNVQVGTLKTPASQEDINNPNAVKVVSDAAGRALYFSRATIPFDRGGASPDYFKHLGFYAYRKAALDRFCALPESSLERSERLEQLRFLENGIPIHVAETPYDTVGVDTEEDLQRVEKILRQRET
jgi:3-deoxy-manno-octulosonate cytidylyltransferase (CMP-KDO synthetase)